MRRILIAALIIFLCASSVEAKVQTYEGVDEYYVLGAVENINVARERAHERALRAAREKAGLYVHSLSKVVDMELIADEIISVASGVLRVVESAYEVVPLEEMGGYLIRAKVRAAINDGDVKKFLNKDSEEISRIVAAERVIRQQEAQEEQRIEALKEEYRRAGTTEEKAVVAQKIMAEDKVFLSNVKLREGNKFRDEGDYKRAAELFGEAIELNPENALAWHNRGWAYIEEKKYKAAMADFDKAEELKPNSELPYFGRGWVYNLQKEYAAAVKEYDKVIELNPRYAVAWNNRGAAKSWQNQMQAAIIDYDKAIELNPKYAKAYENRGKALKALGCDKRADEDFQRAKKITLSNEGADKIIEEALNLVVRGDHKAALKLLNEAAKLYPDNQFVFVNRGNIYNNNFRDYKAAIADYNKTIEINPNFSWAYLDRALVLGRMKRWDEAIADYGRAIELDKNYASAYSGLKRYDEAIADLDNAIKLSPAEGWLYHNRGEVHRLAGDETKAKADFDQARKLGYNG